MIFVLVPNSFSEPKKQSLLFLQKEKILAPGVIYRHYRLGKYKTKHSVHIVETDLINPFVGVAVLKAQNQVNELEKLHYSINRWDSTRPERKILAAINANFWRAYSNRPIGPTIIEGELLEMMTHKKWTSAFFDKVSFMYLDTFFITGRIKKGSKEFEIYRVNRRHDSSGIVFYNKYGGDTIPHISTRTIKKAIEEIQKDKEFDDSTEKAFNIDEMKAMIVENKRSSSLEVRMKKVLVSYIDKPTINKEFRCIVREILNNGPTKMPKDGAVISLGEDFNSNEFSIGDTLQIEFKTNVHDSVEFYNGVSGTPRLVRDGKDDEEAREEGSRGRRFIKRRLSRTAIGTNKMKTKIYFVVVESSSRSRFVKGANLSDLAYIMKYIGCYDAMNLDGGGSSMMIINNNNLLRANPLSSRKISVGLSIYQKLFKSIKPNEKGGYAPPSN